MARSLRPNLQPFLDRLLTRSCLNSDERQAVLDWPIHAEQVKTNYDFVRIGEPISHSCLVVAGIVGRFEQDREGARQIIAIHIPGDLCDLHSVVHPVPTSALQALSVATIARVPHEAIRAAARRYPALAEALWRDCMVDAAILGECVVNVGRRPAQKRVAHLFCEMAVRFGAVHGGHEVRFDFPVTQTHLADATALTAVHINRTLQCLRGSGLIEWRSHVLRVLDWDGLVELAEFDPAYLQMRKFDPGTGAPKQAGHQMSAFHPMPS